MNETIKKFLKYAFEQIDYSYDGLTETEKTLATRKEFEALVKWVKE